jgi:hypothetical protein
MAALHRCRELGRPGLPAPFKPVTGISGTLHAGNPIIANALLDRLPHGAHHLQLKGETTGKLHAGKTKLDGVAGH